MYEYPFGNGQQLNLDWFLNEWKNLLAAWEAEKNGIEGALQAEIDRAEAALADVFSARDAAAQSASDADASKSAAAQSASDASEYLTTVRADANTASNAAQNAAQSKSNAAESAQTALASKNNAANSERNAAQSEANANSSKNAAAQSAADALAHKDAAAQSAADADASKRAAAQSAEDAEDAAASVEASAQQITTNANDISNLKESIDNLYPNINNKILWELNGIGSNGENYEEQGRIRLKTYLPISKLDRIVINPNVTPEVFSIARISLYGKEYFEQTSFSEYSKFDFINNIALTESLPYKTKKQILAEYPNAKSFRVTVRFNQYTGNDMLSLFNIFEIYSNFDIPYKMLGMQNNALTALILEKE